MVPQPKDVNFIFHLFSELDKNGIKFAVLRKAEKLSTGIFNDIDWAVETSRKEEFHSILKVLCQELGWAIEMRIPKCGFEAIRLHTMSNEKPILLHFDLFDTFSWNGVVIFSNEELLSNRYCINGTFSVSKPIEAMIQFLTRYLFNGYVKDEYKDNIYNIHLIHYDKIEEKYCNVFGDIGKQLVATIVAKEWTLLERHVKIYRKAAYKTLQKKSLIGYVVNRVRFQIYNIRRIFNKYGVVVYISSSRNEDKQLLIKELPRIMYRSYDESCIGIYDKKIENIFKIMHSLIKSMMRLVKGHIIIVVNSDKLSILEKSFLKADINIDLDDNEFKWNLGKVAHKILDVIQIKNRG